MYLNYVYRLLTSSVLSIQFICSSLINNRTSVKYSLIRKTKSFEPCDMASASDARSLSLEKWQRKSLASASDARSRSLEKWQRKSAQRPFHSKNGRENHLVVVDIDNFLRQNIRIRIETNKTKNHLCFILISY